MGHKITKTQKADVKESMDLATPWVDPATSRKPSRMRSPCVICTDRAASVRCVRGRSGMQRGAVTYAHYYTSTLEAA